MTYILDLGIWHVGPFTTHLAAQHWAESHGVDDYRMIPLDDPAEAPLRIHDLRHSFASFGVSAGLSLPQIGGLLGHASPQTTARYAHLVDETAADAAAKVAALISPAMRAPAHAGCSDQ